MNRVSYRPDSRTVGAAAMLALVLPPRDLPHPLGVDVVIGAAALLQGYVMVALGLAVVRLGVTRIARGRFVVGRTAVGRIPFGRAALGWARRLAAPHPRRAALLTALLLVIAVVRAQIRTGLLHDGLGLPSPSPWYAVCAVGGAIVLAGTVALVANGLWTWLRAVLREPFRQRSRARPRRRLVVLVSLPVLVWALASARSGPSASGPGPKETEFRTGVRDAATITALTHRPAVTPLRIYVPRHPGSTAAQRARLAVTRTERAGGLHAAAVLLVVPTGSGWVNHRVVRTVEELYDGDLATVAVQYTAVPSWLGYLRGGDGVQESAARLIRAMRARIDRLPAGHRPRLLLYGESLGAWGALPTLTSGDAGVDAALLTGVPGRPSVTLPGLTVLDHPDDPVPDWSPFLPPVAFWRVTADVVSATGAPVGHGHRYGSETAAAWCRMLPSSGGCRAGPPPAAGTRGPGG